jgi:hypothetical protein
MGDDAAGCGTATRLRSPGRGSSNPSLRASASAARATSGGTSSGHTIALPPSSDTIANTASYGMTQ